MIVTAVLAGQLAGTLLLSDTSRVDGRWTYPLTVVTVPRHEEVVIACDVATVPSVRMTLRGRQLSLILSYAPTITAVDVELQEPVQVFQTGNLAVSWRERKVLFTVSETASYGQFNSALLYTGQATAVGLNTPTPAIGVSPPGGVTSPLVATTAPTTITSGGSTTAAAVRITADRLTTVAFSGGYAVAGGLGAASQAYLPEQYGPFALASVATRISATETLVTGATWAQYSTGGACPGTAPTADTSPPFCRINASTSILEETYRRRISLREQFSLGLGIAASTVQPAGIEPVPNVVPDELVLLPYAEAGYSYAFDPRNILRLGIQMLPVVDARTGLPTAQLTETGTLTNAVTPTLSLVASASANQPVPFPGLESFAVTSFSAGLEARKRLDRLLSVSAGLTGFYQAQAGYTAVGSVIAYAGITGMLPTVRF